MQYDCQQDRIVPFTKPLTEVGRHAYAFSIDSQMVAVSQEESVKVYPTHSPQQALAEFSLPKENRFVQMLWTHDPNMPHKLLVLSQSKKDNKSTLITIDTDTKTSQTLALKGVSGLLGWIQNTPVVIHYDDSRIGDEAAVLAATGETKPLFSKQVEENDAGEYVVTFHSKTTEAVLRLGADDSADPTRLLIASATQPSRQWLSRFPYLDELSLAPQGAWATFVDRSPVMDTGEQGGHIYITGFGSDQAMLILEADPEQYTFASPRFRP